MTEKQNKTQQHIEREKEPCAISDYKIQKISHLIIKLRVKAAP